MNEPVAEIRYSGRLEVRPYRRGTYLGDRHLEEMIERALGPRYSFGGGWHGEAEITISLFDEPERRTPRKPEGSAGLDLRGEPAARAPRRVAPGHTARSRG